MCSDEAEFWLSAAADMMSSTLVETVSINYEDFNDSFLTCGTCLCIYDSTEHSPKLLPCSHTVCKSCLVSIVDAQVHDTGTFRCPICRETIGIPRGGVTSFPPSFIVNQLLDLMSQQRRDVIPKCSNHPSQELLFCETCDTVFCTLCTGGEHNGKGASEHTVIPFSIAIKRMSEILLYKAHLCIRNLTTAYDNVSGEMLRLESSVERTIENINRTFQDLINLIDKRRHEVLQKVRKIREHKKADLKEQLDLIQAEKEKVQNECDGLQYQVEVRNITKKIGDLNEKLDATSTLGEPRENHFIKCEFRHNTAYKDISNALANFGCIKVSTTFPALSTAKISKAITHLRSSVTVTTVDYHGNPRTTGSDPVVSELRSETGEQIETRIRDKDDGTYEITFVPPKAGKMKLYISIFDRSIKDSPYTIEVSDHNNPAWKFGCRGTGLDNFIQPVRVVTDKEGSIFVSDTGNSRIKVLNSCGELERHITSEALEKQSGIGVCVTPTGNLTTVNWRTKTVYTLSNEGELLSKFTSKLFQEPIDVAVNSKGDIIVGDMGAAKVFMFDAEGNLLLQFGKKGDKEGQFKLLTSVTVGCNDEILVADHRIQIFDKNGKFLRQVVNTGKGQYEGITVDPNGLILATKTDRGKGVVQVFNSSGNFQFAIDSFDDKLMRPSGLVTVSEQYVYVVDLGNNCLKKFRYK